MNTEREKLIELADALEGHAQRMLGRIHQLADEAEELHSNLEDTDFSLEDVVYPDDDLDDIEAGMLDAKETLTKLLS
jgi:hypothetical protein